MANNSKTASGMTARTKVTIGVMVIVVVVLIWQISGLFNGSAPKPKTVTTRVNGIPTQPGSAPSPQMVTPKVVNVMPQGPSPQEAELLRLQQESQTKYLQAINELQYLRVAKEIATTTRDISSAKLTQVLAEKKIVDTLMPVSPPPTVDVNKTIPITMQTTIDQQEVSYTVVSISQLQNEWTAVLNYKGNLYNIHVGDVLPPDGSTVSLIRKNGVTLEKDGVKKKLTLVAPL